MDSTNNVNPALARWPSVDAMLERTRRELATIRDAYARLADENIPYDLRIDIHDLLTHYRAVLDYLAQEIAELCFPRPKLPQFPIARIDKDRATYTKELSDKFRGLHRASHEVFDALIAAQHFGGNQWLASLNLLANENKHDDLSMQFRGEFVSARVGATGHPYGLTLSGRASARIEFGSQMTWRMPDRTILAIRGPQVITVDTEAFDDADPGIYIRRTSWSDFKFSKVPDRSVIGLLDIIDENLRQLASQLVQDLTAARARQGK